MRFLVLDVAPLETALDPLNKRRRDRTFEMRKVACIDLSRKSERSINNRRIKSKEILRNTAGSWVLGVQARNTDLRRALQALLEVDTALGKDRALELGQGGVELGGQTVLENEASLDAAVCGDGEEFGGAWVDVRGVEAAGVKKEDGC